MSHKPKSPYYLGSNPADPAERHGARIRGVRLLQVQSLLITLFGLPDLKPGSHGAIRTKHPNAFSLKGFRSSKSRTQLATFSPFLLEFHEFRTIALEAHAGRTILQGWSPLGAHPIVSLSMAHLHCCIHVICLRIHFQWSSRWCLSLAPHEVEQANEDGRSDRYTNPNSCANADGHMAT